VPPSAEPPKNQPCIFQNIAPDLFGGRCGSVSLNNMTTSRQRADYKAYENKKLTKRSGGKGSSEVECLVYRVVCWKHIKKNNKNKGVTMLTILTSLHRRQRWQIESAIDLLSA